MYDSQSPPVLVGGGMRNVQTELDKLNKGENGNIILDELHQTMHNKTSFQKALFKYLPKDENKRKVVLSGLCNLMNITEQTEHEQINRIRQCCIDNDNTYTMQDMFKSVLHHVVFYITVCVLLFKCATYYFVGIGWLILMSVSDKQDTLNDTITGNQKIDALFIIAILSLFTIGVPVMINRVYSHLPKIKPFLTLFRGENSTEEYKTLKAYLMGLKKT